MKHRDGVLESLLRRLRDIIPSEHWDRVLSALEQPPPLAIRLNPLRGEVETTLEALSASGFMARPLEGMPLAYLLEDGHRRRLTETTTWHEGRIYIQGLASQLAAPWLDPQPGEEILDLAAAPGGKTLHLAALMGDRGIIAAVEPVKARFHRLRANLQRGGVQCARLFLKDGRTVGAKTPGRFARVLLDAPCSSEARIRLGDPLTWSHWSEAKLRQCAHKQHDLIASAFQALRPGGRLLYATCSFAPEENEAVIHQVLRRWEGQVRTLETPPLPPFFASMPGLEGWRDQAFLPEVRRARRILPGPLNDGFFICLLEKSP